MPDAESLTDRTGVTRSLLAWSLGIVLALVGVIYGLMVERMGNIEDRLIRLEAVVANRGERIAILESGRSVNENNIRALDGRMTNVESHLAAVDISLASHRAATEGSRRQP